MLGAYHLRVNLYESVHVNKGVCTITNQHAWTVLAGMVVCMYVSYLCVSAACVRIRYWHRPTCKLTYLFHSMYPYCPFVACLLLPSWQASFEALWKILRLYGRFWMIFGDFSVILMIFDDCLMKFVDFLLILMIFDDFLDELWSFLIIFSHFWSFLVIFHIFSWFLIIFGDFLNFRKFFDFFENFPIFSKISDFFENFPIFSWFFENFPIFSKIF